MSLSPEERKRRAQVIRYDSKAEFWTLIKEELRAISEYKKKEALEFIAKHEVERASECSNQAKGIDLAIGCPEEILKAHDNIYNRITSKIKEAIKS